LPEPAVDYGKFEKKIGCRKKLVLLMNIAHVLKVSPKEYGYHKINTKDVTGNFLESTTCSCFYL